MTFPPSQDVFADTGPDTEPGVDHHATPREGVPPLFQVESLAGVPVVQRAAESFLCQGKSCVEPTKIVGHRKGRRSVTISVPTTVTAIGGGTSTPLGVQVSDQKSYLDVGTGFNLNPGDSLKIESEAEVWIAPLGYGAGGANANGYCQYVETFDAPSGPQP